MAQLAWGRYEIEDAPKHLKLRAPFKRATTFHASLFWTPLKRLTFAAEFIYYYQELYKKAKASKSSSGGSYHRPEYRNGKKDNYILEDIDNFRLMFSAWFYF